MLAATGQFPSPPTRKRPAHRGGAGRLVGGLAWGCSEGGARGTGLRSGPCSERVRAGMGVPRRAGL